MFPCRVFHRDSLSKLIVLLENQWVTWLATDAEKIKSKMIEAANWGVADGRTDTKPTNKQLADTPFWIEVNPLLKKTFQNAATE